MYKDEDAGRQGRDKAKGAGHQDMHKDKGAGREKEVRRIRGGSKRASWRVSRPTSVSFLPASASSYPRRPSWRVSLFCLQSGIVRWYKDQFHRL